MILACEQNKQTKVQTQNHRTTKRKNKKNFASPAHFKRKNAEVIYERILLAGAKFRISSTL